MDWVEVATWSKLPTSCVFRMPDSTRAQREAWVLSWRPFEPGARAGVPMGDCVLLKNEAGDMV